MKSKASAIEGIKLKIDPLMESRFTYYWKQLIPGSLGHSALETPLSQARYHSLFNTNPFCEKSPFIQEGSDWVETPAFRSINEDQEFTPMSDAVG